MGARLRTGRCLSAAVLLACVIGGCGGQAASPGERAAVRELVPAAAEIRCERVDPRLTRCRALSGNALSGVMWTCELTEERDTAGAAYSGSHSCWESRD